ncbi:MAG TPA: hypothetical protein VMR89_05665 [Actinomycetota bacterium]|nr:hypothetical protein [Actinomycetota bacterium]
MGSGGRPRALVGACMAAALVLGGCTGDGRGRITEIDLAQRTSGRLNWWSTRRLGTPRGSRRTRSRRTSFEIACGPVWGEADLARANIELGEIQIAVIDEEPKAAAKAAGRLQNILAGLEPGLGKTASIRRR